MTQEAIGTMIYIIGITIGVFIMMIPGVISRRRQTAAFEDAFKGFRGRHPEFKIKPAYGFSSFVITFETEAEMKNAESEGCIIAFKGSIQKLCQTRGKSDNPFDVNRAVSITYKGETRRYVTTALY